MCIFTCSVSLFGQTKFKRAILTVPVQNLVEASRNYNYFVLATAEDLRSNNPVVRYIRTLSEK